MESRTESTTPRLDLRECSNMSVTSLAVPRRNKVFDKTFMPAGDTLPVWAATPLDQKFPIVPSPRGTYTFYTNKIGEPKYTSKQNIDFDLTNPQGREAPKSYDSLTDPSLKTYFASPRQKRHLIDSGLVTHRGEIVCTLKDFNEYREFSRYRSVTELSLEVKKKERQVKETQEKLFMEWPVVHRKRGGKKHHRNAKSEPPQRRNRQGSTNNNNHNNNNNNNNNNHNSNQSASHSAANNHPGSANVAGLEMYNENLALSVQTKRNNYEKRGREFQSWQKSPRRAGERERDGQEDQDHLRVASPNRRKDHSPRSRVSSEMDLHHPHSVPRPTIVEDMRKKELQLNKRLEDMRKQRVLEHKRKVEESWKERQYRQEKLLQQEADLEARVRDERAQHILHREKTILQQRGKQEAKLKKIRADMGKSGGGGGGGGAGSGSYHGSSAGNSISPKGSYYTSVTPKGSQMTPALKSVTPKEDVHHNGGTNDHHHHHHHDDEDVQGGGGGGGEDGDGGHNGYYDYDDDGFHQEYSAQH